MVLSNPKMCHFRRMGYRCGDSDDTGRYDEWLECGFCGHTEDLPPDSTPLSEARPIKKREIDNGNKL